MFWTNNKQSCLLVINKNKTKISTKILINKYVVNVFCSAHFECFFKHQPEDLSPLYALVSCQYVIKILIFFCILVKFQSTYKYSKKVLFFSIYAIKYSQVPLQQCTHFRQMYFFIVWIQLLSIFSGICYGKVSTRQELSALINCLEK